MDRGRGIRHDAGSSVLGRSNGRKSASLLLEEDTKLREWITRVGTCVVIGAP